MRQQSFFKRIRWIPPALVLLGVVGLLASNTRLVATPDIRWIEVIVFSDLFGDIAKTLVIIGGLSLLLELSEFSTYFEDRLLNVVVHGEFLKKLDPQDLKDYSISAMRACVSKVARNPDYKAENVIGQVYSDIVPLIGKVYREGYRETVEFTTLTPAEVEKRLDLKPNSIPGDRMIAYTRTITNFSFIAPTKDKETPEPFKWWASVEEAIPGLSPEKHVRMKIRVGGGEWEEVQPSSTQPSGDGFRFDCLKEVRFKGKTLVEMEDEEYSYDPVTYLVKKMMYMTRGMTLTVVSGKGSTELDAEIFGLLTEDVEEPHKTPNSIGLNYEGWLLPNDGYVVYGVLTEVEHEVSTDQDGESAREGKAEGVNHLFQSNESRKIE
jgi:hypothetical protein